MDAKPVIRVVAAIILDGDSVCCFRRLASEKLHLSRKFEFPGGKVEPGESEREALVREIREELGANVSVKSEFDRATYEYPDHIVKAAFFLCTLPNRNFTLTVHSEVRRVASTALETLDWIEGSAATIRKLADEFSACLKIIGDTQG